MAGDEAPSLADLVQARNLTGLIKRIDAQIKNVEASDGDAAAGYKLNRGSCYHHLGLYRKALKVRRDLQ
jgi:hypothetical protein